MRIARECGCCSGCPSLHRDLGFEFGDTNFDRFLRYARNWTDDVSTSVSVCEHLLNRLVKQLGVRVVGSILGTLLLRELV